MRRIRLLVLLGVVLAVGATAQAKTKGSTTNQKQEQNSKDQAKSNDGHRKHWWSMPHFHHKKADAKQTADAKRQAEPTVKVEDPLIEANRKPKTSGTATAKAGSQANHGSKPMRTAAATHKSTAHTRKAKTTMTSRKPATKRVAATHNGKTAHHTCSAEEAGNGGCQAAKRHTQKPVVRPAAAF